MTVSTVVNREQYEGNGTTTVFPYRFRILNSSHLTVVVIDPLENLTTLTLGTDYTISGISLVAGGTVVLAKALPSGWAISIERNPPAVQETDLRNQGRFFAETHEDTFDYLTMLIQRALSVFTRALQKPSWLSKYYDALLNRISNLGDPIKPLDATNLRTTVSLDDSVRRYAEDLVAGVSPGSGTGAFQQLGIGAVTRTFQDKMRDTIDVKDFGVKMDGVTDDTVALNRAFSSGKAIRFPSPVNGPSIISGTLLLPDNIRIYGPGKDFVVIKCADNMDPYLHAMATSNYAQGAQTSNKYVHIEGICIDGNGYKRAPGTNKPDGCCFVINAEDSTVKDCHGIAAPVWNLFITSGNPYDEVGHDGKILAPSKRILVDGFTSTDPIHGDGGIIQGTFDSLIRDYTSIYTSKLVAQAQKVRADTGLQLVEGCRSITVKNLTADHGGTVTTALEISCHANMPYMSDIIVDGVTARNLNTAVGLFNDISEVSVNSSAWKNCRYSIRNVHLSYPVLDTSSSVMQARLVDVQNASAVKVGNVSVSFLNESGAYSSPTAVINFSGTYDFDLDGFEAKEVPDVGTNSYGINRARGWVALDGSANKRGRVRNVKLDNIGYFNRVISDTSSLCLDEIKNVTVDSIPSDGQSKSALYCGSSYVEVSGISVPTSMLKGSIGPLFTSMPRNNMKVAISDLYSVMGGISLLSSNPSGQQTQPGIEFSGQFASASGSLGKGAIAFRTSSAVPRTLPFTAYDEDSGSYVPILTFSYSSSSSIKKYIAPIVNGDTNNGNASSAWLNGYFINAPQTVSDARLKDTPRDINDLENKAFYEISRLPMVWKWINRVEDEGDTARWHSGPTVQAAISIMDKHGLNWEEYSCFCHDYSKETPEQVVTVSAVIDDDSGQELTPSYEYLIPANEGVDKYSFRKEELLWWCLRALTSQLDKFEERLARLES